MARIESNGLSKKCLVKTIQGIKIYLYKSWDFTHGIGYFVHSVNTYSSIGFGFHKTNKFTAVKNAISDLKRFNR